MLTELVCGLDTVLFGQLSSPGCCAIYLVLVSPDLDPVNKRSSLRTQLIPTWCGGSTFASPRAIDFGVAKQGVPRQMVFRLRL